MEISFKDVQYKKLFHNLNFEINYGRITAIIGKNSSGKTSLMNLIYGLDIHFNGEILIDNKSLNKKTQKKQLLDIRKDVSYVRQDFEEDLFNINVYEDIKYGKEDIEQTKLKELLNAFNLDETVLNKCYIELNRSEKKKILLIKSLVLNYKILIFDDITSGLDNKSVSNLIKILKKEKRNDKLIIISSTDSDFLLSIADNFIIIEDGYIKINSDKYDVLSNKNLLKNINMSIPNLIEFKLASQKKRIKLINTDNINDLIKDIYRNAK